MGIPSGYVLVFVLAFNQCHLECDEDADLEELRDFTSISSDFYPDLSSHYDHVIDEWYSAREREIQAERDNPEPGLRRALAQAEKCHGPDHYRVVACLKDLAQLLKDKKRLEEAESILRRALAIDEKARPKDPSVATDLNHLAQLLKDTNRVEEAEQLLRRALAIDEKNPGWGGGNPKVGRDFNNLAALLRDTNRPGEAEPMMRRALKIFEETLADIHTIVEKTLKPQDPLYPTATHRNELALDVYEGQHGIRPDIARCLNDLAALLKDTNRPKEAEPMMRRALVIVLKFTREAGYTHPDLSEFLRNYSALLKEISLNDRPNP